MLLSEDNCNTGFRKAGLGLKHIVGIIAEYNPFHCGHAYQIREARRKWGDDAAIVVVMSGSFTQRGEPSIASKWSRTKACLDSGADLVFEIPFSFACAPAERFARGAVFLLHATGIVTDLFFGSECEDMQLLSTLADILSDEPPFFSLRLQELMREGASFAGARQKALCDYFTSIGKPDLALQAENVVKRPNVILGIEYLIAVRHLGSLIVPSLLLRRGAGYHETDVDLDHPSASALRNIVTNSIKSGFLDVSSLACELSGRMPDPSLSSILSEYQSGVKPVFMSDFTHDLIATIRRSHASDLERFAYMGDQVAARMKNAVSELREEPGVSLYESLRSRISTKRYAGTRTSRASCALLVGETEEDIRSIETPPYLRVLGFSDTGRYLLKIMRKSAIIPIVDKPSDFLEFGGDPAFSRSAELDCFSNDLWCLKAGLPYGDDFSRTVIFEKNRKKW
jgi:predicted nucleotidyltransferase